jgi:hypothetical protein
MFCEECGGKVSPGAKFCSSCGLEVIALPISEEVGFAPINLEKEQNFELGPSGVESAQQSGFADPNFRKLFIAISATIVIILSFIVAIDLNTMDLGSTPEDNYSQEVTDANSGAQSDGNLDSYSSNDYFNLGSSEAEAGIKNRATSQALIDSFGGNRAYCEGIAQIYAGSPADALEAYISGCTDYLNNNPHYVP